MFLLTLVLVGSASEPCGKAKMKEDPASGVTTVQFRGADWEVIHDASGTRYTTSLFRSGPAGKPLESGWNLDAKLQDGSAVRLSLQEKVTPKSSTNETGSWTRWDADFLVSSDAVGDLAKSPITALRMDLGFGPDTTEITRGRGKKIQTAFACIETFLSE